MASIGPYTVDSWPVGRMQRGHRRIAVLAGSVGPDGSTIVRGGSQAPISVIETITVLFGGDAEGTASQYRALEDGDPVSVTDQFGVLWTAAVLSAEPIYDALTTGGFYLRCRWRLLVID